MNGALNNSLVDPWPATSVSFLRVLILANGLFACMSKPLPSVGDMAAMAWWAPLGDITGAIADTPARDYLSDPCLATPAAQLAIDREVEQRLGGGAVAYAGRARSEWPRPAAVS